MHPLTLHVIKVHNGQLGGLVPIGGLRLLGGRGLELDPEHRLADGEDDVGAIDALGLAVLSELGRELGAHGGVGVAAGVFPDDLEKGSADVAGGAHDGGRGGGEGARRRRWEE